MNTDNGALRINEVKVGRKKAIWRRTSGASWPSCKSLSMD
jgi:hypothetical protein